MKRDGKEMPAGFFSNKLSDAETRYSATELEGLAVVPCVELNTLKPTLLVRDSLSKLTTVHSVSYRQQDISMEGSHGGL